EITNKHNDPGKFTTLIAFEWTSIPYGQNLHRNVFFRDDEGPAVTFSAVDSDKEEDLWTYLETERKMGHEVFAIPHNGNVSNSLMYNPNTSNGVAINKAWAARRARNEVATEIIQTKGQSDTHPALSPYDEFADFEMFQHLLGTGGVRGEIDFSFVRQALINGVGFQEAIGANPFKYGIVAGADAHTGFSDNEEFNYTGVHGVNDDTAERRLSGAGQTAGEAAIVRRPVKRRSSLGRPAQRASGLPRTHERRSSTPSRARKPSAPRAHSFGCASSAVGATRATSSRTTSSLRKPTPAASRWAETCLRSPRAPRRQPSRSGH
ncbi:MAG: DUF3604 domain-containing protein, partial [Deltaproteobacteria bacterium]|nr:DUF3604 domain-containing protein [Deltaproteobacteria bacterium]